MKKPELITNKPRVIQLDILRGIAILLVIGTHAPFSQQYAGVFDSIAKTWIRFGWTGVDLFFVLSGFLIGGLLFNEILSTQKLNLSRFFIRRIFKIWPSYYLCVFAGYFLVLVRNHGNLGQALQVMWPNLVHVQNYYQDTRRPIEQTWSLAIEEHFYLVLPLLLWLLASVRPFKRKDIPLVPLLALLVMVLCLMLRVLINGNRSFQPYTHLFPTHIRIDSLFFGVLLAYYYHFKSHQLEALMRHRRGVALTGIILIIPMAFLTRETTPFVWTVGYTMLYLGYGCLLLALLYSRSEYGIVGKFLTSGSAKFLAWVGTYSYTIYLWFTICAGKPVEALFHRVPQMPSSILWFLSTTLYLAMAILSGYVAGKLVDKPALVLRERLFPSRVSAVRE